MSPYNNGIEEANEGDTVITRLGVIGEVTDVKYMEDSSHFEYRYIEVRGGWFLNDKIFGSVVVSIKRKEEK